MPHVSVKYIASTEVVLVVHPPWWIIVFLHSITFLEERREQQLFPNVGIGRPREDGCLASILVVHRCPSAHFVYLGLQVSLDVLVQRLTHAAVVEDPLLLQHGAGTAVR